MVWLAQQPDDELRALAQRAADRIGLPLTVVPTGLGGLERALEALLPVSGRRHSAPHRHQPVEVLPSPRLGLGDLVEGVDVQPGHQRLRPGQHRRAALEEPLPGEAAGRREPGRACPCA